MTSRSTIKRYAVALGAGVLCSGVIAACGSSSSTSASSGSTGSSGSSTTAGHAGGRFASDPTLVACLKKHGVTLPTGGAGFHHGTGTGTTPSGGTPPAGFTGTVPSGATGTVPSGGARPGGFKGGFGESSKLRTALKDCGASFGGGPSSTSSSS